MLECVEKIIFKLKQWNKFPQKEPNQIETNILANNELVNTYLNFDWTCTKEIYIFNTC
jgi:uncharacterized protein YfcZ (UPF0381/DUF406 family)